MQIRWTTPAFNDLERITDFLLSENPTVARDVVNAITQRVAELSNFPELGRAGEIGDTRELPLTRFPYVIVYRVGSNAVEVLHIFHGAQDWK